MYVIVLVNINFVFIQFFTTIYSILPFYIPSFGLTCVPYLISLVSFDCTIFFMFTVMNQVFISNHSSLFQKCVLNPTTG